MNWLQFALGAAAGYFAISQPTLYGLTGDSTLQPCATYANLGTGVGISVIGYYSGGKFFGHSFALGFAAGGGGYLAYCVATQGFPSQ